MEPVDEASERPPGREPALIEKVYGAVPPEKAIVCAYADPICPTGRDVVVMRIAELIAMLKACEPKLSPDVANTVKP